MFELKMCAGVSNNKLDNIVQYNNRYLCKTGFLTIDSRAHANMCKYAAVRAVSCLLQANTLEWH